MRPCRIHGLCIICSLFGKGVGEEKHISAEVGFLKNWQPCRTDQHHTVALETEIGKLGTKWHLKQRLREQQWNA